MEEQGKRLLLAVAAAFGVMMLWMFLFPPEEKPKEEQPATDAQAAKQPGDAAEVAASPGPAGDAPAAGEAAPPPVTRGPEDIITFEFPEFRAEVSTWGGTLRSWQLIGDRYRQDSGKPMELVPHGSEDEDLRAFTVGFTDASTFQLPGRTEWQAEKVSDTELRLTWQSDDLVIQKTYRFVPEERSARLTVAVKNVSGGEAKQALRIAQAGYQDPSADKGGGMMTGQIGLEWKAACYVDGDEKRWSADTLTKKGEKVEVGNVEWAGFDHSYFLAAVAPTTDRSQLTCRADHVEGRPGVMVTALEFPIVSMASGNQFSREFVVYYGPKYLDRLEKIDREAETLFAEAVDLGDYLGFIARPLLWLLDRFYSLVGNWGLAIILLTFLVKLATLHWTTKSMRSMKEMGKLKPEIEKIQKKYKDDKQRQQVEIMNLYKSRKVNPLAGCLPMLLQMPIWFALYRMLMKAAELYRAPFIPGWIDDLTSTDPYYILPVAVMVMMFVQSRLSPTTPDNTQQKVMMYGLPLIFGVFSFFFPAGLVLYIFTNTTLTALHHLWMNRDDLRKKAEARAAGPGAEDAEDDDDGDDDDDDAPLTAAEKAEAGRSSATQEPRTRQNRPTGAGAQRKKGAQRKRSKKKRGK